MSRRRKQSWRRRAALLAILGLMIQASFSVVHSSAMAMKYLAPGLGQDVSGVIFICTPAGIKTIRADAGDSGNEQQPTAPDETCPVCSTFAGHSFALVADDVLLPSVYAPPSHEVVRLRVLAAPAVPTDIFVRGPPHIV